jgi:hypothetical protein
MNTNSMQALSLLMKKSQIPVIRKCIVNKLQRQPDSPSLLAIS